MRGPPGPLILPNLIDESDVLKIIEGSLKVIKEHIISCTETMC